MSTSPNYVPTPEEAVICRLVRAHREHLGVPPETLAEAAGVTLPTYLRIERGERPASFTQLHKICRAMNVGLEDFAEDAIRITSQRSPMSRPAGHADRGRATSYTLPRD